MSDMNRKERFQKAFDFLVGKGLFRTKTQLADIMHYDKQSVTKAYNGYENYLTNGFLQNFCATFPDTFNLEWLIEGEGTMLVNERKKQYKESSEQESTKAVDINLVIQLLMKNNEDMRKDIEELRREVRELRNDISKLQRAHHGYGYLGVAEDAEDAPSYVTEKGLREKAKQ